MNDEVVDAHGDEIDTDRVMQAAVDRELDLGADAVIRGNEDRIDEAGRLQIEEAAETADFRIGAWPPRRPHERLDRLDHRIAGINADARLGIGKPLGIRHLARRLLLDAAARCFDRVRFSQPPVAVRF